MPLMLGIGAVAAPIVGGAIGSIFSSGDAAEATRLRQEALQRISSIQEPQLQELALRQYTQQGILTPEEEKAIKQDPSELKKIQVDERYKEAQLKALGQMQEMGDTAFTQADRAAMTDVQLDADRAAKARRLGVLQNLAARGMGGGGAELAAQLQAQQEESNQASQKSRDLMQQALARRIQAVQGAGTMGGQLREQEFGQQAKQAEAQDIINRFNTQFMQGMQQRNIDRRNLAEQANLQAAQDIANRNIDIANKQQIYNVAERPLAQFNASMRKGEAQSAALGGAAAQKQQQAQNTQQTWSQLGSGVGAGVGAFGQYQQGERSLAQQKAASDRAYELEQQKLDLYRKQQGL